MDDEFNGEVLYTKSYGDPDFWFDVRWQLSKILNLRPFRFLLFLFFTFRCADCSGYHSAVIAPRRLFRVGPIAAIRARLALLEEK